MLSTINQYGWNYHQTYSLNILWDSIVFIHYPVPFFHFFHLFPLFPSFIVFISFLLSFITSFPSFIFHFFILFPSIIFYFIPCILHYLIFFLHFLFLSLLRFLPSFFHIFFFISILPFFSSFIHFLPSFIHLLLYFLRFLTWNNTMKRFYRSHKKLFAITFEAKVFDISLLPPRLKSKQLFFPLNRRFFYWLKWQWQGNREWFHLIYFAFACAVSMGHNSIST